MSKNQLDADTLINGTSIAAKIIQEHPDLDEDAIDAALMAAYAKGASVEEWEAQTRKLLGVEGKRRDAP